MTSFTYTVGKPDTFVPSPQQAAFIGWVKTGRGSLLLRARAGTGKSTTLVYGVREMVGTSVAVCAYNKSAGDELKDKLESIGVTWESGVRCGTFHSHGLNAWRKVVGDRANAKDFIDDKKVLKLCQREGKAVPEHLIKFVTKAVSLAKQRAFGVVVPSEDKSQWLNLVSHFDLEELLSEDGEELPDNNESLVLDGLRHAVRIFRASVALDREVIDYDDMILAPLIHNARVWKNNWVLVDEAQDTNPARRALAKKMLMPGGRAVFVGDPAQAIYGFTGADNDALEVIKREFSCQELPLTVTRRCPKSVVRLAQGWVPDYEAHPDAAEGSVETMTELAFTSLPAEAFTSQDAVLCRNTKPLVAFAFALIRRGIPCHVEGKDIGNGLLALATKWKGIKKLAALASQLERYQEREVPRLLAKGKEQNAANLEDRVATLQIIISSCDSGAGIDVLRAKIDALFGNTPEGQTPKNLTLATIHKSKGREWSRVYWLGRNRYQPSPFARQEWQQEQEQNLMYVAATRTKDALVDVIVPLPAKRKG
jgi:DNA helicase-2/ATP-dependent DNA helicase PcrA